MKNNNKTIENSQIETLLIKLAGFYNNYFCPQKVDYLATHLYCITVMEASIKYNIYKEDTSYSGDFFNYNKFISDQDYVYWSFHLKSKINDIDINKILSSKNKFYIAVINSLKIMLLKKYLIENNYLNILIQKWKQLVYIDEYGDQIFDSYEKEISRFVSKKINDINHFIEIMFPKDIKDIILKDKKNNLDFTDESLFDCFQNNPIRLIQNLNNSITNHINKTNNFFNYIEFDIIEDLLFIIILSDNVYNKIDFNISDPYEYEKLVAEKFIELDWESYRTKGSGDQGADVVATKDGIKVVIQCKLLSKNLVGNKAVQEVSSAKDYYDADYAVVISNQSYTKSARQLAESQNVFLLHHSEIEVFSSTILSQ